MTSEKYANNLVIEDKDMENVNLHRAESMVNDEVDRNNIKDGKTLERCEKQTPQNHKGKFQSFMSELRKMKIEVVLFLYMFSYILRSVSSTSMIIDKVCLFHLEYSQEICKNLSGYRDAKNAVDKLANNYQLGHMLIQLLPSTILVLFVGSWSDKYSRKIPIIAGLIGIIIDGIGSTLCAYYFKSRVEYYFIPAIFTGISGGFISVFTVLYSYASDVSTSENRTIKYALIEIAYVLSTPLGSLCGGYIFKYAGYVSVFLTSTCGHIIGLFWVIFVLEETRGLECVESLKEKLCNLWNTDAAVESFRAAIKKRPNKGRAQIWWLTVAMGVGVFNYVSIISISFIYVHNRYDWGNTMFSTVSAVFQILTGIVVLIFVPICKKLEIGDPILGLIGSISLMIKNIVIGIASETWIYYTANFVGLLSNLASLAGRARISKVTSEEDLGKVFAFFTTAECLLPIAGTTIASQILNASLETFPGLIFIIMGLLIIIPIGIFIWLHRLPDANHEEMNAILQNQTINETIPGKILDISHDQSHEKSNMLNINIPTQSTIDEINVLTM